MITSHELLHALILLAALFFALAAMAAVADTIEWALGHRKKPRGRQPIAAQKKHSMLILRQKEADVK